LLAGPSRPAVLFRRLENVVLDAGGRGLAHAGRWVGAVGRALLGARWAIQVGVVLAAVVALILADRPGIPAVLWTTVVVLLLLAVVELFIRGSDYLGARHAPVGS
ncbi:MAG TPA: hypothetical protein VF163_13955, partial [Micromonosporaceae bacterium]